MDWNHSQLQSVVLKELATEISDTFIVEEIRVSDNDDPDSVLASSLVIPRVTEEILNPEDDLQKYIDAKEKQETRETIIEDSEIVDWVSSALSTFNSDISISSNVAFEQEPQIYVTREQSEVIRTEAEISLTDENLAELCDVLVNTSTMIPSEDALRTMTVRISDFDSEDHPVPYHDFTIYFATETPHEYWANCETIEDYFEMVTENNDDTTIEDMRNKNEYYSHTHLMNDKRDVIDWLESFTNTVIENHITVSNDITVNPYKLNVDFETGEISLNVSMSKDV